MQFPKMLKGTLEWTNSTRCLLQDDEGKRVRIKGVLKEAVGFVPA